MKSTPNLTDIFSNSTQGSGGDPLAGFFDPPAQTKPPQTKPSPDLGGILAQEGAEHLAPVIEAIYRQESAAGKNARTSLDGARGGMQVMPDTFRRFARAGERIDDPEDNLRVGVRIVKNLAARFGNDPAKIATGYFSGEGNVNAGQGSAWKADHADGNGKRVSDYVAGILGQLQATPTAQPVTQANAKPDLTRAPKWAEIEAKPDFQRLPEDRQNAAKSLYFDYWIAPHAGTQSHALRQQFMDAPIRPPERTWGEALADTGAQLVEGVNTVVGAVPNLIAPESRVAEFFNDNAETARDWQSDALKRRMEKADQAIAKAGEEGVADQIAEAAGQYFSDPGLAARFVVTNLPSMIPGIGAAKMAQAAALARGASAAKAAVAATTAAGATNAVLNGGGARGEAFQDIRQTLLQRGYSEEQATEIALTDSRVVAAVGGITGYLSGKLGLESALFGKSGAGGIKAGAAALVSEAAGEQLEEVSPKLAANAMASQYDERSLGKDVGRTIVETAIGASPGSVMSGVVAGLKSPEDNSQGSTAPTPAPAAPVPAAPAPVAPTPVAAHPTVQAADAIVRELATEAGIPLDTVLPTPESSSEAISDQDVVNFAEARRRELRAKRDGHIESALGDTGMVDTEVAGIGLSEPEQQELAALEQGRGNASVLRALYGIAQEAATSGTSGAASDGAGNAAEPAVPMPPAEPGNAGENTATATEQPAIAGGSAQATRSANAAPITESAASLSGNSEGLSGESEQLPPPPEDISGLVVDGFPASEGLSGKSEQLPPPPEDISGLVVDGFPAQKQTQTSDDPVAAPDALSEASADALRARLAYIRQQAMRNGWTQRMINARRATVAALAALEAGGEQAMEDAPALPAQAEGMPDAAPASLPQPRTEREANERRDYSDKWFASRAKAETFIDSKGIRNTHAVVQDGKRFLIRKKDAEHGAQTATPPTGHAAAGKAQQTARILPDAELSAFLNGAPVEILRGDQAPMDEGFARLRQWATALFDAQGGKATSPEIGEVLLDERAVRDSLGHGRLNRAKAEAFAAVKRVIEKGRVVHVEDRSLSTESIYQCASRQSP